MAQEIKNTETGPTPVQRYMDRFTAMRAEMDRVFDSFLDRGFGRFPLLSRGVESAAVTPSIDVRETATELVVEAELPGMDEKDINVTLNYGVLTLKGEKKAEHEEKKDDYHLLERSYGSCKVKATFEKGVLKVTLPKRPEAVKSAKQIPIGNS